MSARPHDGSPPAHLVPGLEGKKGVIITTSAASKEELKSGGTLRALRAIYDEGLMQFTGMELVEHL